MTEPLSARQGMSLLYTEVKNKEEDLPDLLVSQVNFYGKEIDFFFLVGSMTRIEESSEAAKLKVKHSLVQLQPEEI